MLALGFSIIWPFIIQLIQAFSPDQHQAITYSKAAVLLNGPSGTNFCDIHFTRNSNIFIHEFENVTCKMATIFVSASMC